VYCVEAFKPLSVYDGLVCHELLVPPGLPEVSVKRYSTGPLASLPVVAVMLIAVSLIAAGATANVAGFGVGGSVSGGGSVVAFAGLDAVPTFGVGVAESRIVTV
jgi:hypothetical protein